MKILLTGQPHSGKTTLLAKVIEEVEHKQGFVTKEIKPGAQRVGFELIATDGTRAILAHVDHKSEMQVSRYFVDVHGLEEFIEPLFHFEPDQLLYIDEIGQMELFSDRFKDLVRTYLDSSNNFVGTITSVYTDDFVEEIKSRKAVQIIEVTEENRDELVSKLTMNIVS